MIVSINRSNTPNIGDLVCNPFLYYDDITDKRIDLLSDSVHHLPENSKIIIGGGGLFHNVFRSNIKRLVDKHDCATWAIGYNDDGFNTPLNKPDFIDGIKLLGNRDYNSGHEYVPCPSCKFANFSKDYKIKREFSVYQHLDHNIDSPFDKITNDGNNSSFSKIVEFIGESNTVITNSYHGAYWSMLLNRNVILYRPFSNRFRSFKPKYDVINDIKSINQSNYSNECTNDKTYLNECIDLNDKFYLKIKKFINED